MNKTALIAGISGQDGAYLASFLIKKGYNVLGGVHRTGNESLWRLDKLGITDNIEFVNFDLTKLKDIEATLENYEIDELYNLAAESSVNSSFNQPLITSEITGLGVTRILTSIRRIRPSIKFYQASSSEMFGNSKDSPVNENSNFHPRSPYGISKLYAYWITINHRESYDIFACNGILFNHESPLRPKEFVTRKITSGVAKYENGFRDPIELGNLSVKRDWGFAGDYVPGMWKILQADEPDDYILASGENHSVREFVEESFSCIGVKVRWDGEGLKEKGFCSESGDLLVIINPKYYRPSEIISLLGDYSKAKRILDWSPKTSFRNLVEMMVKSDLTLLRS